MSPALSVAASLSPDSSPRHRHPSALPFITYQPAGRSHQLSRKFVYQQGDKAQRSLDESFAPTPADDDVLFHLPVTKNWLYQLILGLVLICHSSYRGVVEVLRDHLIRRSALALSTIGSKRRRRQLLRSINSQDLSGIEVGLHDEFFRRIDPC